MRYRPDIDGLRAIAILLVVFYHAGLPLVPSGFVGVDVFFVISGFLISSILVASINQGQFSLVTFYSRRLWRLQPAYVCFIFASLLLTLLLFLPDDLIAFDDSARKTSLFISNRYFGKTTSSYFAPDVHQLPLLHTWSLSIEWQCYLLLPLFLYGLYRLVNRRFIPILIFLLCIVSYLCALSSAQKQPLQTYYFFSSRIFEFLLGSWLALLPSKPRNMPKALLNGLGILALCIIFYTATRQHIVSGYPNMYALMVCLATGLLLALGKFYPERALVALLSWRPLVFIGLISYSLYLWHWLVFALMRYESIVETPQVIAIALVLSFVLAYLSWKWIEKPARRFNDIPFRYALLSLLLIPIVLVHANSYVAKYFSGFPQRFNQDLVRIYEQLNQFASKDRPLCISKDNVDIEAHCKIGAVTASKTGLLIGDSFSNHYWGFMDTLGKNAQVSILAQGISSCLTLPGIYLYDWWYFKDKVYQECYDKTQSYYQMLQQQHYDYVIIGHIWSNYFTDNIINKLGDERSLTMTEQRIEAAMDQALQMIINSGAKPVLINATASMQENAHDCVFKYIKLRKKYDAGACSFKLNRDQGEIWFDQLFSKMQAKYPQLILIDPKKVQCPQQLCRADIAGVPVYRDAGHITDFASYQFANMYLQQFGNPLNLLFKSVS